MKVVKLTVHAEVAAAERGIELAWIEQTAHRPDWRSPDPADVHVERRLRAVSERDGRVLRVACVEMATEIRVVTVFFDRGAKRP